MSLTCHRCGFTLPADIQRAEQCPICTLRDLDDDRTCRCARPVLLRRYGGLWFCVCRGSRREAA
jgi:hypothetical protein